ncbi:MAG TPA: DUF1080 domain-containing protein [Gemmatimonadaceae bacterium]|nr:DUF1080 domain-containing protein [Gemmatimonadaceae bacterium]
MRSMPFIRSIAILTAAAASLNAQNTPANNTLTDTERAEGWHLLFDGVTTNGWRGYQMTRLPDGWKVQDGMLMKEITTEDIVTVGSYGDFELTLEWKVGRRGNAGLFYRATEQYNRVYWSSHEYQIFTDDSTYADGRNPLTSAGAVYGFYPAARGVVKPANEWNTTKIVAKGTHVEHWLNGTMLAQFEIGSPDWEAKFKASKFTPYANYAREKSGRIAIQGDHNGILQLRNIKIREFVPPPPPRERE